jgi:hypothetical protein
VGMYSPGKAFVVYEMRRHVYEVSTSGGSTGKGTTHFAYSTVARHDALEGLRRRSGHGVVCVVGLGLALADPVRQCDGASGEGEAIRRMLRPCTVMDWDAGRRTGCSEAAFWGMKDALLRLRNKLRVASVKTRELSAA